jgi:hypothetical protein
MVKIFEGKNKQEEELIMAFLRASGMEDAIREVTLVPVEDYGSEGLMPLTGRCPEYPDTDISCVGGSGDNMCGCFMGQVKNIGQLLIVCAGGTK